MATVDVRCIEGVLCELEQIESDARKTLALLDLQGAELSVLMVDDAFMRPLNLQYRGQDKTTDVLSFGQQEGLVDPAGCAPGLLLGDIVISVQTATRQAHERGTAVASELRVLLVHGVCHLLGHDHETDDEADVMQELEQRLLKSLVGVDCGG